MRILTVCTGNICRSPTAEGVLRHMAPPDWHIDSCGTAGYHIGENPDPRAIAIAKEQNIDISNLIARQITETDFSRFDKILAMDRGHLTTLQSLRPHSATAELHLYMQNIDESDVPDPYYQDIQAFRDVLQTIEKGARSWLK